MQSYNEHVVYLLALRYRNREHAYNVSQLYGSISDAYYCYLRRTAPPWARDAGARDHVF